jgi:hypothetical protein
VTTGTIIHRLLFSVMVVLSSYTHHQGDAQLATYYMTLAIALWIVGGES